MSDPAVDVVLIGCVKSKLDAPAPAEELFCSPLFRCRRDYAERSGRPWFVISSWYGLLRPETVIAPYDLRMSDQPVLYRRLWGTQVAEQLRAALGDLNGKTIEIHAGAAHAHPLAEVLAERGAAVLLPLRGLSQGQHLAWYAARRGGVPLRSSPAPS